MRVLILAAAACGLAACGRPSQAGQTAQSGAAQNAAAAVAPADSALPNAQAQAGGAANGQAVFGRTCVTCHQANGQGLAGAFPPLARSPYVSGEKAKLIRLVLNGLSGPVTVGGQRFNGVMPPWKGQLSDAEVAAVLTYVRSSFGNTAGAVSAPEVQQERAATASRNAPWTIQELDRAR